MLCRLCFHRVLYWVSGLWPLLYYNCLHPALPLMFYSISLLLSTYYTMSIPCLISLAIYLPASACLCSRYSFQYIIMIQFYRYTWAYLCTPLGIRITLVGEFWFLWILMSRSQSLQRVDFFSYWPEKCSGGVDLQQTIWNPILPGPSTRLSSIPSINSWAPFVLFIFVHLFAFSHLRLSVM